jgi:hypothetical protein
MAKVNVGSIQKLDQRHVLDVKINSGVRATLVSIRFYGYLNCGKVFRNIEN